MSDFPFHVHSLGLLVHCPKVLVAVCLLDMIAQAFRSIRRSPLHGVPAADVLAVLSYQYATHDSFTHDCRLELHKLLPCPSRFGLLRCCYELHFDLFAVVLSDQSFFVICWNAHPRCRRRLHTCDLYLTTTCRDLSASRTAVRGRTSRGRRHDTCAVGRASGRSRSCRVRSAHDTSRRS